MNLRFAPELICLFTLLPVVRGRVFAPHRTGGAPSDQTQRHRFETLVAAGKRFLLLNRSDQSWSSTRFCASHRGPRSMTSSSSYLISARSTPIEIGDIQGVPPLSLPYTRLKREKTCILQQRRAGPSEGPARGGRGSARPSSTGIIANHDARSAKARRQRRGRPRRLGAEAE